MHSIIWPILVHRFYKLLRFPRKHRKHSRVSSSPCSCFVRLVRAVSEPPRRAPVIANTCPAIRAKKRKTYRRLFWALSKICGVACHESVGPGFSQKCLSLRIGNPLFLDTFSSTASSAGPRIAPRCGNLCPFLRRIFFGIPSSPSRPPAPEGTVSCARLLYSHSWAHRPMVGTYPPGRTDSMFVAFTFPPRRIY